MVGWVSEGRPGGHFKAGTARGSVTFRSDFLNRPRRFPKNTDTYSTRGIQVGGDDMQRLEKEVRGGREALNIIIIITTIEINVKPRSPTCFTVMPAASASLALTSPSGYGSAMFARNHSSRICGPGSNKSKRRRWCVCSNKPKRRSWCACMSCGYPYQNKSTTRFPLSPFLLPICGIEIATRGQPNPHQHSTGRSSNATGVAVPWPPTWETAFSFLGPARSAGRGRVPVSGPVAPSVRPRRRGRRATEAMRWRVSTVHLSRRPPRGEPVVGAASKGFASGPRRRRGDKTRQSSSPLTQARAQRRPGSRLRRTIPGNGNKKLKPRSNAKVDIHTSTVKTPRNSLPRVPFSNRKV